MSSESKIVIDLDGTLTIDGSSPDYGEKAPDPVVVARLREYAALGFRIVVHTARNMRTFKGEVGQINVHTLPVILDWLKRHEVPFDEVIVGKPWCGPRGFYVDDRAVRPDEFGRMSPEEVAALLGRDRTR